MSFVQFISWLFEFTVNLWIVLVQQSGLSPPKFLAGGLVASLKPWKHMIISRSFYLGNFFFFPVFLIISLIFLFFFPFLPKNNDLFFYGFSPGCKQTKRQHVQDYVSA